MNYHLKVRNEVGSGYRAFCGAVNARLIGAKSKVTCKRCLQKIANIPLFPNMGIVRAYR